LVQIKLNKPLLYGFCSIGWLETTFSGPPRWVILYNNNDVVVVKEIDVEVIEWMPFEWRNEIEDKPSAKF